MNKLNERLLLFRHDYDSPNILQMINAASEVTQDSLVEIVLSGELVSTILLIYILYIYIVIISGGATIGAVELQHPQSKMKIII